MTYPIIVAGYPGDELESFFKGVLGDIFIEYLKYATLAAVLLVGFFLYNRLLKKKK